MMMMVMKMTMTMMMITMTMTMTMTTTTMMMMMMMMMMMFDSNNSGRWFMRCFFPLDAFGAILLKSYFIFFYQVPLFSRFPYTQSWFFLYEYKSEWYFNDASRNLIK